MKRAIILAALAIALAACGGQAPITKIGDDVASICLSARAEYAGYRDWCDVTRSCPAAERQQGQQLSSKAENFCAAGPPDTAENRTKAKAMLRDIVFLGVRQ